LIQTPRADFSLRAENLLAFHLSHLDSQNADLLTLDDISSSIPLASLRTYYALVDHNRILPKFLADPNSPAELERVKAIFDHHDDEGFHKTANPRIIRVPTGSCASIVADYFRPRFPSSSGPADAISEVASLLLSAIAVDTSGLKEGGKAEPLDRSASQFLYPLTSFGAVSIAGDKPNEDSKTIPELADLLIESKRAVSNLAGRDLLRRDYKEYEFGSASAGNLTRVGLSTVPMGLNHWIERDGAEKFWAAQDAWMKERNLTCSGVLTTFRTITKNKHKREMLLIFPSTGTGSVADSSSGLELKLYTALEANEELDMERKELDGIEGRRARAWEQRNKQATRKTIAPALRAIIEGN
jgi:exopolyphosphatase